MRLIAVDRKADVLPLITCPECGSTDVYSQGFVTVSAYINLNNGGFLEPPKKSNDIRRAHEEIERFCNDCEYEWEVDDESND